MSVHERQIGVIRQKGDSRTNQGKENEMMIGSSPATAIVAYRGTISAVPRDAVQPVTASPKAALGSLSQRRVRVFGMPGAIVDLVA